MRRHSNSLLRLRSTMFALSIVPQIIDIVNSTNIDPDSVPDVGHSRLIEGSASRLEWWLRAGFLENQHHLKAAFLVAIFFFLAAFMIIMRWGCWKAAEPGLKHQKQLADKFLDVQSNLTTVHYPSNWTIFIPYEFKVDPFPTSSKEWLNYFPSRLTIGICTGFTTGVGPRR